VSASSNSHNRLRKKRITKLFFYQLKSQDLSQFTKEIILTLKMKGNSNQKSERAIHTYYKCNFLIVEPITLVFNYKKCYFDLPRFHFNFLSHPLIKEFIHVANYIMCFKRFRSLKVFKATAYKIADTSTTQAVDSIKCSLNIQEKAGLKTFC